MPSLHSIDKSLIYIMEKDLNISGKEEDIKEKKNTIPLRSETPLKQAFLRACVFIS